MATDMAAVVWPKRNQLFVGAVGKLSNMKLNDIIQNPIIQGGSNMTGTDCSLFTHKSVPLIFEPPCTFYTKRQVVVFENINTTALQYTSKFGNTSTIMNARNMSDIGIIYLN